MELDGHGETPRTASSSLRLVDLDALRRAVARLVDAQAERRQLRAWVPGCGSGELAYAVAAIVREEIHRVASPLGVRIFATDVDAGALRHARAGWFPAACGEALAAIDLGAHFLGDEAGYRARPALRDMCIFAGHDVLRDPPLHRLDLIVCSGASAASEPTVAQHLARTFRFALSSHGLLVVDPALRIADADRFVAVFPERGVYRIRPDAGRDRPPSLRGDTASESGPWISELRGMVPDLEHALDSVHGLDRLRRVLDDAEADTEALICANEELQCAKEELHSANEDLASINAELAQRVEQIDRLHADLDNILRSSRLPTVFLDREGRIRWLSPAVGEVLRSRPQDVGRPLGDLRMRVRGADLAAEASAVVREEVPREVSVHRTDTAPGFGPTFYRVRLLPYRSRSTEVEGVVVTFIDVTELEVARQALERHAARQHAIAELGLLALEATIGELFDRTVDVVRSTLAVPCCEIMTLDARGDLLRREAMAGWPRAPGTEPAGVATLAAELLAERQPVVVPASAAYLQQAGLAYTASGSIRDESSVYGLLRAHAPERDAFDPDALAFVSAVCSLVGAAVGRHRAVERLREQSQHKDDFLAMLGHELRNPLAAIASASELQQTVPNDQALMQRSAAVIRRQVGQMVRVIDDLLDVSRFTRGKIVLDKRPVELGTLVRTAVEDHRGLGRSGLELELVMEAQPIVVVGDRERLVQVLTNLISNAVQFTDPPGTITISLARREHVAELRVSDTGCGIEPEFITWLFEPFRQAPQSVARQKGGLGLGLALVEQIVVQHGGSVRAQSPGPGRGATFTVLLPISEAPCSESSSRSSPPAGLRILLVDDNRDLAELLAIALGEAGYEVVVAGDATEGCRAAEAYRPDVVLCDIGLPGTVDGYGYARWFQAHPDLRPRALISLSGYGRAEDAERARRAGFDLHLIKPIDIDSLLHAIARALQQRSEAARA